MTDISAATPQMLRRVNAAAVLAAIRTVDIVTVSGLMDATGQTRVDHHRRVRGPDGTRLDQELENQRAFGEHQKGRPARRFELDESAGCVLGIDVGALKTTVVVADLRGMTLGRASQSFTADDVGAQERIDVIDQTAVRALDVAATAPETVLAVTIGLAAPVDRAGDVLAVQRFWTQFDGGLREHPLRLHGWSVALENDANLAALGERWRGSAVGVDDLVVLLAGERFGSGVLESGRLLHGSAGGVGEMAYLDMVAGVGSTDGLAALARSWAAEALAEGAQTLLRTASDAGEEVTSRHVFTFAAQGDEVATAILDRLAERLARVISTMASMLNPELVVLGGAVADSASVLLEPVAEKLAEYTATPPRIATSPLGDAIVSIGAVRHALDHVETNFLDLDVRRT